MSDGTGSSRVKAPWHLWLVVVLGLLWNAMGCLDYVMTKTKNEEWLAALTEEQVAYFDALPAWLVAFWAVAVWGGLLGVVLLLLRKRLACTFLTVSLGCMMVTAIYEYGFTNAHEVMGTAGLVFTGIIFVISLFLVLYSRAMARRRVLT